MARRLGVLLTGGKLICTAALASFNVGYSNNVIAGSFAQIRFIAKFLSGGCAISLVDIIVSGYA